MVSSTEKIGLIKPSEGDYYDIEVFNGNSDKIDKALSDLKAGLSELGQRKQMSMGTMILKDGEEYIIPESGYKIEGPIIFPSDGSMPYFRLTREEGGLKSPICGFYTVDSQLSYSHLYFAEEQVLIPCHFKPGDGSGRELLETHVCIIAVSGGFGIRLDAVLSCLDEISVGWMVELMGSNYEQPERRNPYARNEVEDFDEKHGGLNVLNNVVENTGQGDWLLCKDMDFKHGAASFVISLSSYHSSRPPGGALELRLDHPNGPVAGTVQYASTDAWNNFKQFTCAINGAVGIHHLYLVFTDNGNANLDWFQFTPI